MPPNENTFHIVGMWINYTATMQIFLESSAVCGFVQYIVPNVAVTFHDD